MRLIRKALDWLAWQLWGKRRWLRECEAAHRAFEEELKRLQKNTFTKGVTTHTNGELTRPLRYDDMHLEHYDSMSMSGLRPVVPPPDTDDGDLN